ncbi:hypothetical protein ACSBR1_020213 [Camellia fascicularis]
MQCNFLSSSISRTIDKINHDFLWGSTSDHKKMYSVGWAIITKPKCIGGLGIRQTMLSNKVVMAKLGWQLQNNKGELWARVLKAKYPSSNLSTTRTSTT